MMTDWYQKSINALALNGKGERTQEAYTRALRMLCEFYGKIPEEISEAELEAYFLHSRNVDHWSPSAGFYLPVHALSPIFRAKFRDAMAAAGVLGDIPTEVWTIDWNVNCQAVGQAAATLRYLARYVFQAAISERRILRVDDTQVRFHYRKPDSSRVRTLALPVMEFMRRLLQHVLPRGFVKVRYYGFLSPSFGFPLEDIRARIELAQGFARATPKPEIEIEPLAPALSALRRGTPVPPYDLAALARSDRHWQHVYPSWCAGRDALAWRGAVIRREHRIRLT